MADLSIPPAAVGDGGRQRRDVPIGSQLLQHVVAVVAVVVVAADHQDVVVVRVVAVLHRRWGHLPRT